MENSVWPPGERDEGRAPLARRLERMARGEPTDGAARAALADSLEALLAAPLDLLCRDGAARRTLRRHLYEASCLLVAGFEDFSCYGGALRMVRLLRERCGNTGVSPMWKTSGDILLDLAGLFQPPEGGASGGPAAMGAAPRPLAERLRTTRQEENPAALWGNLPLRAYFSAAGRRLQSGYPEELYCRRFLPGMRLNTTPERSYTLSVMAALAQSARQRELVRPGMEDQSTEATRLLYDLLVEPIYPGADHRAGECAAARKEA